MQKYGEMSVDAYMPSPCPHYLCTGPEERAMQFESIAMTPEEDVGMYNVYVHCDTYITKNTKSQKYL